MTSMPITNRSATAVFYRIVWHPLDFVVSKIESLLLLICSLAIIAAMLLTTTDVATRYLFKSPVSWAFDFVMLSLLPAAHSLAFSYGMMSGSHLAADFVINYMRDRRLCHFHPAHYLLASSLWSYL